MWRFVGIVAVAVAVLGAGCGGGDGAALPAGQYDVGHGVTVAVGKVTDPVEVKVPDELATDIRNPVEPGTRWVAIDLEYFNHTDDVVDMTAAYGVDPSNIGGPRRRRVPPRRSPSSTAVRYRR
jgi:hypothetical protein